MQLGRRASDQSILIYAEPHEVAQVTSYLIPVLDDKFGDKEKSEKIAKNIISREESGRYVFTFTVFQKDIGMKVISRMMIAHEMEENHQRATEFLAFLLLVDPNYKTDTSYN